MEHKTPKPDMTGLTDAEAYIACCKWAVEEGYKPHWLMDHFQLYTSDVCYASLCVPNGITSLRDLKEEGIPEGGIFYSKEDPSLAVYCQSPEKARRCVYTQIKPGRLLAKLGRPQAEIEKALAKYSEHSYTLEIVSDSQRIAELYQEARIGSCMRFGAPPDPHPCEAYGGTHPKRCDLYIVRNKSGNIVARSIFPVETGIPIRWYIGDNVSAVKAFLHFKGIEQENRSQQGYYIRKLSDWYGPYLDTYTSDRKPTGEKDSEGYEMYEICDWSKGHQVHCDDCDMYGAYFDYNEHGCEEDIVTCDRCGCRVHEDSVLVSESGEQYCEDCYSEFYALCDSCNEECDRDDVHELQDGYLYCDDCYDRYAAECAGCGGSYRSRSLSEVAEGLCCRDCLVDRTVVCTNCGVRVLHPVTAGYLPYCEECFETQINVCPTCSKVEKRNTFGTLGEGERSCHTHCQTCSAHVYFSPRPDSGLIDLPVVHA